MMELEMQIHARTRPVEITDQRIKFLMGLVLFAADEAKTIGFESINVALRKAIGISSQTPPIAPSLGQETAKVNQNDPDLA